MDFYWNSKNCYRKLLTFSFEGCSFFENNSEIEIFETQKSSQGSRLSTYQATWSDRQVLISLLDCKIHAKFQMRPRGSTFLLAKGRLTIGEVRVSNTLMECQLYQIALYAQNF